MSKAKSPVKSVPVEHDYDTPEGVRAAVVAAKGGDIEAAETLARRLTWILSGEAPYSEAEFDQLIEVAESGWSSILNDKNCHPEDMFQYAVDILWDDEGALITENAADASGWMLRAAELGHPDAQLEVGRFYLDGVGLKQSDALAVEWFTKAAADKENADHAEFFLAELKKKAGKAAKKAPVAKKAAAKAPKAPAKKTAPAKKAPAKKAVTAKVTKAAATKAASAAKKPAAKAPAKKPAAQSAAKPVAKKPVAKAPAKKAAPVKKAAAPAKKAPAKKAPAKKALAKKSVVTKAAPAKKAAAPAKKPAAKAVAKPAAKVVKKAPAKKAAAKRK